MFGIMHKTSKVYYYCAVPKCNNTSTNNQEKKFFSSPADPKRRRLWLKQMRRDPKDLSSKTTFFVCEDHFNLESDLKNFIAFKYGNYEINALKSDAVPSLFECQNEKNELEGLHNEQRLSSTRRLQKKFVDEVLICKPTPLSGAVVDIACTAAEDESVGTSSSLLHELPGPKYIEKSTQTSENKIKQHFRSKYSQCDLTKPKKNPPSSKRMKLDVSKVFTSSESETDDISLEMKCNEGVLVIEKDRETSETESNQEVSEVESEVSIYSPSDSLNASFVSTISNENDAEEQWYVKRSREYTGIPEESRHIVGILTKLINCSAEAIYVVLVKIRKNYTNIDLSDRFNMNEKEIRTIFATVLPPAAEVLKHFVQWPTPSEIKITLPIAFRRNFRNVQAIIDAFEIEIQKPTDPLLQALTWSEYKKCNTMKYLVVSAPNGLIMFISDGYGGRISDIELTKKSGFLDKLPTGASVLADRGFKGIESVLQEKGCKLIRPPSVQSGTKMTKADFRRTKQVASIRIHIERAIRRLREFYLLKLHSCVHHKMMKYLDHCVIIACGIVNLQPALIRYT